MSDVCVMYPEQTLRATIVRALETLRVGRFSYLRVMALGQIQQLVLELSASTGAGSGPAPGAASQGGRTSGLSKTPAVGAGVLDSPMSAVVELLESRSAASRAGTPLGLLSSLQGDNETNITLGVLAHVTEGLLALDGIQEQVDLMVQTNTVDLHPVHRGPATAGPASAAGGDGDGGGDGDAASLLWTEPVSQGEVVAGLGVVEGAALLLASAKADVALYMSVLVAAVAVAPAQVAVAAARVVTAALTDSRPNVELVLGTAMGELLARLSRSSAAPLAVRKALIVFFRVVGGEGAAARRALDNLLGSSTTVDAVMDVPLDAEPTASDAMLGSVVLKIQR